MAPSKEKKDKLSTGEGSDLVLDYLRKQNRPYSATDISSNLLNKVSKTHTAKYLKELHDKKAIQSRASGKQIVYHAIQAPPKTTTPLKDTDLEQLDERITAVRANVATLRSTEKSLKSELASASSIRSLEEVQDTAVALKIQRAGLLDRLSELKAATMDVKPMSEEDRKKINADLDKWRRHAKLRKTAVKNLWLMISEQPRADDSTLEEFWESLGCDGPLP